MPSNTARPPPADRSDRPPGHDPGSPGGASGIVPAPTHHVRLPDAPERPRIARERVRRNVEARTRALTRIHDEISAMREEVAAIHAEVAARKSEPQPAALDALNEE
jgi:hypothetical protein